MSPASQSPVILRFASVLTGWAVRGVALAMVLCIAVEGLRASQSLGKRFLVAPVVGFGLAVLMLRAFQPLVRRLLANPPQEFIRWVVLSGCLLQLGVILLVRTQPVSDFGSYWYSAEVLWNEGEYVCLAPGGVQFRARKTPGMAIYLAPIYGLFGGSWLPAQLTNVLLVTCGNVLFYRLLRERLGRPVAVCATVLLALWPSRWLSAGLLGYDPPGSFAVILFWFLSDGRWRHRPLAMFAAGLAVGAATLLRPPMLLLFPAFLLYRLVASRGWRRLIIDGMLIGLGLACILGPWAYRNHRVLGKPVITATMGGISFYRGFHPDAGRYYSNVGWLELAEKAGGDEVKMGELGWEHGLRFIAEDPFGAVVRVLRKWYTLLESDHEPAGLVFDQATGAAEQAVVSTGAQRGVRTV